MYEKKLPKADKTGPVDEDDCFLCSRPRSIVVCSNCQFVMDNIRARKKCNNHPRVIFHMDINACTKCKSPELLEVGIDDIPVHLVEKMYIGGPFAHETVADAVVIPSSCSAQATEQPSPMAVDEDTGDGPIQPHKPSPSSALANVETKPDEYPRRKSKVVLPPWLKKPKKEQVVTLPGTSMEPSPPVVPVEAEIVRGPCVCNRQVSFLLCPRCGYHAPGVKKFTPCPQHPEVKDGIKFCPECGVSSDKLDEY